MLLNETEIFEVKLGLEPDDVMPAQNKSWLHYEIVQSAYDPNRPWELIVTTASGQEVSCIRFRTYGEAWHEVQRRKKV